VKIFNKLYRRLGRLKYKSIYSKKLGALRFTADKETSLVSYYRDGKLDYETYKAVQQAGNIHKLTLVSANEAAIVELALVAREKAQINFVLCHGTRNGAEQRYFKSVLTDARVLGTEISDTASQFENTIQWDFHEVKPEWRGAVDLLYSNSWDHTYDPNKLFATWGSCISPNGIMALEHTVGHLPDKRAALDPFGATIDGLVALVERVSDLRFIQTLDSHDVAKSRKFVIFARSNA
jgi:type VI protein secretion system component Hcp